eukprot:5371796-Prymnesium_polylepis.1
MNVSSSLTSISIRSGTALSAPSDQSPRGGPILNWLSPIDRAHARLNEPSFDGTRSSMTRKPHRSIRFVSIGSSGL